MMRNKKFILMVLPLLVHLCHAHSVAPVCHPGDSVVASVSVDSAGRMTRDGVSLKEVVVSGGSSKYIQMKSPLNVVRANKRFIEDNFKGSLMQTLSRLPGVQAMSVGSGESKPVIRGLGFNRVLVAENGIKHESQQWGDDHGLEIDQFAVDQAEVVKGPSALIYGSDAVAGVIDLKSNVLPMRPFCGQVTLFARSNNESTGASVRLAGKHGRLWYKANATLVDYADYQVPADSIEYYSYWIKLKDRRLRNTAGREKDVSLLLGYAGGKWNTYFRLADVCTKAGFFADAHGLEVRLSDIDYDKSRRDIDLPYHTVNHLSLSNHTDVVWDGGMVEGNVAYQYNRQREFSEPVSHGYMPIPPGALERSFSKHVVSANLKGSQAVASHHLQAGTSMEWQCNRRGGWGFILPDFSQLVIGAFAIDQWHIGEGLSVTAGMRYDHGHVGISSYRDWYKTPADAVGDSIYVERSADMTRDFDSFIWSVGINRLLGRWMLKLNVGKSFRMPIAKELGMDGVNYSIFRYEKGNASLDAEESYQADAGVVYEHGSLSVQLTPYINYFSNFIYLNPTPQYKEGLQLYCYTQAKVMRWGLEASVSWKLAPRLQLDADGEYLYARQMSGDKKGYTIPYSTPWSACAAMRYLLPSKNSSRQDYVSLEWKVVGAQNRIVPPEETTRGYQLLNAGVSKSVRLGYSLLRLSLRGDNLLGKRYYDHTSYYRLIGVPEPGRSFSAMLAWIF